LTKEARMEASTLKIIILILIGLAAIWVIRVFAKREWENAFRSAILLILLLGAFFYVERSKAEKITWEVIKEDFKRTFFPEKPIQVSFTKHEGVQGGQRYIRYYFGDLGPKLSLTLDSAQQYFHIKDVHPINRVLEHLGLEKVKNPVPELASITGSRNDLNFYRWDDYPLGTLILERQICQDRDKLESYACIASITIFYR